MAIMPTKSGGLRLQHPTSTAITSLMMITKRNIQYYTEGVLIDDTYPFVTISPAVANLHTTRKLQPHQLIRSSKNTVKTYGIYVSATKWRRETVSSYSSYPVTNAKIESKQKKPPD
jgi:hypothetical protein